MNLTQLYLERQLLHRSTKVDSPLKVAASICGINAQRTPTIYLSCWNRIENFQKEELDKALYETRALVKIWCMRGTVHIIPSDQFLLYTKATYPARLWLPSDISEDFAKTVLKTLDQPLTKSEIAERIRRDYAVSAKKLRYMVGRAVRMLGYQGAIVFGNPRGTEFYVREYEFARSETWLSHSDDSFSQKEARQRLLSGYLRCYGPATVQDFAYWAGFKVAEARKIADESDVENVKIGERIYSINPGDTLGTHPEDEQIVLLPPYDSYVMGYKDKSRIIAKEHRTKVFLPYAEVAATILRNGRIIGTWDSRKEKDTLTFQVHPFERIEHHDVDVIHEEMRKIAHFMNMKYCIME